MAPDAEDGIIDIAEIDGYVDELCAAKGARPDVARIDGYVDYLCAVMHVRRECFRKVDGRWGIYMVAGVDGKGCRLSPKAFHYVTLLVTNLLELRR